MSGTKHNTIKDSYFYYSMAVSKILSMALPILAQYLFSTFICGFFPTIGTLSLNDSLFLLLYFRFAMLGAL